MSSDDDYRGKEVRQGPLAGHYREGKVYRPPIKAMSAFQPMDWKNHELPDMIWLVMMASTTGDRSIELFSLAQRAALQAIPKLEDRHHDGGLDGRLTSLEAVEIDDRQQLREVLGELPVASALLSPHVCSTMAMYGRDLPGSWLFTDSQEAQIPPDECRNFLARAMLDVGGDGHKTAVVKYVPLLWQALIGGLSVPPDIADELSRYPNEPDEFLKVDPTIRAMWMSTTAFSSESLQASRSKWAASFWRQNWQTSYCMPEDAMGSDDEEEELPGASAEAEDQTVQDSGESNDDDPQAIAMQEVFELYDHFLDTVLDPLTEVDLQRPARLEVLTGLTARAYRFSMALLSAPQLWSGEQSAGTFRALFESRLYAAWILGQEEPDEWFEKYQEYGRGKQKLMKSIVDDLITRTPGDNEYLAKMSDRLEQKTGGDTGQMFQNVSLEGNFAGRTVRSMAFDVGLEDDYRMIYQTMSGISHGEWWAIEEYSMQRCMNVLHGFHLAPVQSAFHFRSDDVALGIIGAFTAMLDVAYDGLDVDHDRRADGED